MKSYLVGLYEKATPDSLTWEERLEAVGEAGFDHMEISIDETQPRLSRLDWNPSDRKSLLRAMQESGIPIRSMCLSGHRKYPLGSHDALIRKKSIEIFRKAVDLAGCLGIRIIQLAGYDVYYEAGDADTQGWFRENLSKCVEYAAGRGVLLGFETMETPFMNTVEKAMAYVRDINSPYLGVYPDLGNLTNAAEMYGSSLLGDLEKGRGAMFAMHLKETVAGKFRDMDFGAGRVDFSSGIRAAFDQGVRLFVAEMWHDGRGNWRQRLFDARKFVDEKADEAAMIRDRIAERP